jgi:hypothetical protein
MEHHRIAPIDGRESESDLFWRVGPRWLDRAHKNNDSSVMITLTKPAVSTTIPEEVLFPEALEALFREARRRQRRRRLRWAAGFAVSASTVALIVSAAAGAFGSVNRPRPSPSGRAIARMSDVAVLSCSNVPATRPISFVISCADGNAEITSTKWSSWSATGAAGTTRFAINLCNPYCAASPVSYFPGSTVTLSAPVHTKKGAFFSKMVVTYFLHGKKATFPFSWIGDPALAS